MGHSNKSCLKCNSDCLKKKRIENFYFWLFYSWDQYGQYSLSRQKIIIKLRYVFVLKQKIFLKEQTNL